MKPLLKLADKYDKYLGISTPTGFPRAYMNSTLTKVFKDLVPEDTQFLNREVKSIVLGSLYGMEIRTHEALADDQILMQYPNGTMKIFTLVESKPIVSELVSTLILFGIMIGLLSLFNIG